MSGIAQYVGGYKQITATGNVSPIGCKLLGIFVSSSTLGTVTIYDSATTTTSTKVVDTTVALTGGTWIPIPVAFASGIYIVVGGTLSATVVYA
jgi:nitrogenase subunit NifH